MVTTDQGNEFRGLEGAVPEPAERPERHGSDRPSHPDAEEGPGEGGPGRRRLGRARGDGGAGGRGDEAGGDLPGAPGQRGEVRAQQEPDRGPAAPAGGGRGLAQYGPVREVAGMTVRATHGSETLLKQALPVPRGSGEPAATTWAAPRRSRRKSMPARRT